MIDSAPSLDPGRARRGPVLLAWADSSAPSSAGRAGLGDVGDAQLRRHASLPPDRAARFAIGRRLLAQLVLELVPGAHVEFSSVCARCGADHGRPVAIGLPVSVSVSYAGSIVVAGAVHDRDAASLGVDVETDSPQSHRPMAELAALFAPAVPPDLRRWTMIEAALKADGRGLRVAPGDVVLSAVDTTTAGRMPASVLGDDVALVSVPGRHDLIEVAPVAGPEGLVISVAIVTH